MANNTKKFKKRRNQNYDEKKKGTRETTSGEEIAHKYNDVSWYVKNEAMLRDAASLSFNNPLGSKVDPAKLWTKSSGELKYTYANKSIPGLLKFEFLPCIGKSENSTSPANLAAQNIYSYVRYMNSGSKNYDQADLMLYLLAMDSLYMFWNWAKRIYGYAMLYSQKNKYMPHAYALAEFVDLEDVISNLSDYRLWLNGLAAQISSFCVPAVMPFFIRHSWMCSNIYTDGTDSKAQQYMFVPGGFYCYNETGSSNGGKLDVIATTTGDNNNFARIRAIGKRLMDAVAYSEDIGVMSGDILKAYGQERLFKLAPVDPDYQIMPVYNEEVLTQMENSSIVTTNYSYTPDEVNNTLQIWNGMSISQDSFSGYLKWNPELLPIAYQKKGTILNMHKDEVSPADVMVATRLTACQSGKVLTAVGTEFIYKWETYRFNSTGTGLSNRAWDAVVDLGTLGTTLGAETALGMLPQMCEITQFNRHPLVPVFCTVGSDNHYIGTIGDIANYTIVDDATLEQIHGTAIMSEFNIPQIGSF